ncbi:DUF2726 domain-containing protein [Cyclobacterium plantarum]|uniref:DUF2726 domain-containing protein n=1 Tax=Cyclobacterium plantarum TaxID=2716263 RepID=UPI003F729051
MNPAEDCLKYLHSKNWIELSRVLSDNKSAEDLAESPTYSIFEKVFIDELRRHENETSEDLLIVASRILQIHRHENSSFRLSDNALIKLARYLFDKHPQEIYAKILDGDPDARIFLEKHRIENQKKIDTERISANLNIKVGKHGKLQFDKDIFNNSPQEKELYLAAKKVLPDLILLPNTALSTIIDSKICKFLDNSTSTFFYKSTLDLCVVNSRTFRPELFIELDSSWHDQQKNLNNDRMKDEIFQIAGLKLSRLRKKENKAMIEIFELFIRKNYTAG